MKNIENAIKTIGIFIIISVFIYTHLIIPKYPTINSDYTLQDIESFIDKVLKHEARNYSFEALDSGEKVISNEMREDLSKLDFELKNCKNDKECLIKTYENFMDSWVSNTTKAQTRYLYMDNLGFIGKQINKLISWSY